MARRKEKYEFCETFKQWLAKNNHRFNRKCKIRHYKTKGILYIYFEGVARELDCYIDERTGVNIAVRYKRRFWDWIYDLECAIAVAEDGKYYCKFCLKPKFYKTYQKLLIEHSFKNFLEWANINLTSSHVLELKESVGGSTEAFIVDTSLPDSIYTKRRAAFGTLLKGLSDNDPITIKNLDNIKTTIIPVIKGTKIIIKKKI
jgi:hypothetical protein